MPRLYATLASVAFVALAACGDDDGGAGLTVDLKTDWVPGVEFVTVRTALSIGSGPSPDARTVDVGATRSQNFIAGERIAQFESLGNGPHHLLVGLYDAADTLVAQRATQLDVDG